VFQFLQSKDMKLFAAVLFCTVLSNAVAHTRDPTVLVYNINTQRTEQSQNADQMRPMASVTKLMTAMVALDHNRDLQQQLVLRKGTGSRLPPGTYSREQLLLAMLVSSDNGAAETIAQNYPGGRSAFVAEMNRHARMWDLQDTKFVDPSGLGVFNVTTAQDLVEMVQIAASYWFIQEASGQSTWLLKKLDKIGGSSVKLVHTSRQLLAEFVHVTVSKTGFTNPAGWCVAMLVEHNTQQYVVIVLGASSKLDRSAIIKKVFKNL
jgi:D-alanyl-D-alanine endopeptidase (penicillin-binding protein 7)